MNELQKVTIKIKKKEDAEDILEIVGELDAEYLSDLKPEDIPDDAVSDVEAPVDM